MDPSHRSPSQPHLTKRIFTAYPRPQPPTIYTLIHITLIYYTCHTQTRHIRHKRGVTEVCYLLEVSWQMCHAWITHQTARRAPLTMLRRRSTHNEARMVEMRANPFWHVREPFWRLEHPFLNRDTRNERANRRTEHGEHPTYQIKHF